MKQSRNRQNKSSRISGSAIPVVVILLITTSIIMGSVLRFAVSETRLNRNQEIWMEAKFSAEAISEYGFAELRKRFDSNNNFPEDGLLPVTGGNPLTLPSHFYSFFQNSGTPLEKSNIVLPPDPYDPFEEWGTYSTEIIAGVVPRGEWVFIDPNVPGNENDKLKGRRVFARGVAVYGKATVQDPMTNRTFTAYNRQELHVRDAPLFSHAIFYNLDMEIAPGQPMEIVGPVHVNGNMHVQSGNSLDFLGPVTSSGQVLHGRHPDSGQSTANGDVNFLNGTSSTATTGMHDGTEWLDSTNSDFAEIASERWRGNLMSDEHHVENKPMVDIPDYVADDPATAEVNDALNYGHEVIAKAKPLTDPNFSPETERQKFSYKAGLTVRVDTGTGDYTLVTYQRDAEGDIVYDPVTSEPVEVPVDDSGDPIASVNLFSSTVSGSEETVLSGLRDARRGNAAIDVVEIDMGKLREKVHNNNESDWGGDTAQRPENWWNGVVYVEFPDGPPPATPRPDNVQPSVDGWGVKVTNGQQIPNPSFAQSKDIYGTTLATNNVMYVEGHFNADGDSSTGSPTSPDTPGVVAEPPAALAADAINFLSSNWNDANSGKGLSDRPADFTEVSAAILTGVVPSGKDGTSSYSGGVENFPRLLENWSGDTLRLRGSMVALFESEIATEPWSYGGNIYRAPNRNWGFHDNLASGFYPPGTPNVRTYRRVDFRDLSRDEYLSDIADLETHLPPS